MSSGMQRAERGRAVRRVAARQKTAKHPFLVRLGERVRSLPRAGA